jgi:hypothetical protein
LTDGGSINGYEVRISWYNRASEWVSEQLGEP